MDHRTCPICESAIDPRAHGRRIYCSPKCAKRAENTSPAQRESMHKWRASARSDAAFMESERVARAESRKRNIERERAYDRARSSRNTIPESVKRERAEIRAITNELPDAIDREFNRMRHLRLVDCDWCAASFIARRADTAYCNRRCKAKSSRARRRALECGATGTYTWAEVVAVYRAIGRVCAYCHEYFPLSDIEPDHVIALSVGGSNSITNVAPACKLCNSDKRELSMADWAICRERRGLDPRTLHPLVSHLTLATL